VGTIDGKAVSPPKLNASSFNSFNSFNSFLKSVAYASLFKKNKAYATLLFYKKNKACFRPRIIRD
jgi:hypothetical protein